LGHEFDKSSCEETKGEKQKWMPTLLKRKLKKGKRRKEEALAGKNIHEN